MVNGGIRRPNATCWIKYIAKNQQEKTVRSVWIVRMLALLLLVASVVAKDNAHWNPDVYNFADKTDETLTQGLENGRVSICYADATNKFSTPLINDEDFVEGMTRLNREKIPERVDHAKGTGAFGYFQVTHDISRICKADFLNKVGKKTSVAVRFSSGSAEQGSSDYSRETRGFSVKFYTKEGNFDLLGIHTEMYFCKDPLRFSSVRGLKRKPDSNLYDWNTYWDSITLLPESLNYFLRLFSDEEGIPAGYLNMAGHAVHTYQVENNRGDYHYVRFHFDPVAGVKTLKSQEAMKLGASDPDGMIRELYESIKKGEYPSWIVSVQILTKADLKKEGYKMIDPTRLIPTEKYPLHQVGKLVLNKNAKHFQNEIEKLSFCPCNLVPGVLGASDKLFESRALIYRATQSYRLGKNYNKIPVNCPFSTISTYNRDGMPPVGYNDGDAPNYYPNSFGGPQPYEKPRNKTCKGSGLIKITENPAIDNFDQIVDFFMGLTEEGRTSLIENIGTPLSTVEPFIQERTVKLFASILPDLGSRLANALKYNMTTPINYN